jgi:hypothetical protein
MGVKKEKCQFCGKEIASSGLKNHEKHCAENPEVISAKAEAAEAEEEEVEEAEDEDEEETEEEARITKSSAPDLGDEEDDETPDGYVEVITTLDINPVIGDTRYHFNQGVPQKVPENVKEILLRAGVLRAI